MFHTRNWKYMKNVYISLLSPTLVCGGSQWTPMQMRLARVEFIYSSVVVATIIFNQSAKSTFFLAIFKRPNSNKQKESGLLFRWRNYCINTRYEILSKQILFVFKILTVMLMMRQIYRLAKYNLRLYHASMRLTLLHYWMPVIIITETGQLKREN